MTEEDEKREEYRWFPRFAIGDLGTRRPVYECERGQVVSVNAEIQRTGTGRMTEENEEGEEYRWFPRFAISDLATRRPV
jgi:hypothetical protein